MLQARERAVKLGGMLVTGISELFRGDFRASCVSEMRTECDRPFISVCISHLGTGAILGLIALNSPQDFERIARKYELKPDVAAQNRVVEAEVVAMGGSFTVFRDPIGIKAPHLRYQIEEQLTDFMKSCGATPLNMRKRGGESLVVARMAGAVSPLAASASTAAAPSVAEAEELGLQ